jgi:hypothetical protein
VRRSLTIATVLLIISAFVALVIVVHRANNHRRAPRPDAAALNRALKPAAAP